MTEQLKPCPFCGSNKNVSLKCQTTFTKGSLFWVECECGVGCGAECGEFNNPIDAILSWGLKEMEQLQARIKELESAERTLISLGYENKGGETWKPPIRKRPNFNLIDSLNERIKELESDAHINEIKTQGIYEAVEIVACEYNVTDDPIGVLEKVENYANELRTKHD